MQRVSLAVHHSKKGHDSHSYDANSHSHSTPYNILYTCYKLKHFLLYGKFPAAEALEMLISMQEKAAGETTSGLNLSDSFNRPFRRPSVKPCVLSGEPGFARLSDGSWSPCVAGPFLEQMMKEP